jgi:Spy/CpxP family protein refolding chaperone
MKRPLLKWLFAVSLALNAGMLAAVAWNTARPAPAQQAADGARVRLPEYLKLSADQRRRWEQIERGFLQDLSSNWRDIRSHREVLVRQIFSAVPDRAAIDSEQARIAALQDAQQRRVIAQLLEERALLDEGQRKALMELLLTRYTQEATEEEHLHRD